MTKYNILEKRRYRDWDTAFDFDVTDIPDGYGHYMILRHIACIGGCGQVRLTMLSPDLWANTKVLTPDAVNPAIPC
jgi:hypothetical protein